MDFDEHESFSNAVRWDGTLLFSVLELECMSKPITVLRICPLSILNHPIDVDENIR